MTPPPPSPDFASAALVGMVRRALSDAGLVVSAPSAGSDALVSLETKRDLLAAVALEHGLRPLIEAGRHLTRTPAHPAAAALLAAGDPADLFARWSRLERFVHSRHRVVVRDVGRHHLVAEHVSTTGEPPQKAEDALILGVLAAGLAAIGATAVTARFGADATAAPVLDGGVVHEPGAGLPTSLWRFGWRDLTPSRSLPDAAGAGDAATALRRLATADPGRGWTVASAAAALGTSGRSLQRALEAAGGFAAVLGAARAERAGDLLINSTHALSLVGFACGYADQPHFTREFKRRTAMTPAAYRRSFAAGRSPA